MKKTLLLLVTILVTHLCTAQSLMDGIDAADAATLEKNIQVVIKDKVSQVVKKINEYGKPVIYVNFGEKWPQNSFTLIINEEDFNKFPQIFKLNKKFVEVEGITTTYKYKMHDGFYNAPCIILKHPSQLN